MSSKVPPGKPIVDISLKNQGNTSKTTQVVRLTLQQYALLEKQVLSTFDLRATDPGSLGVQVGAERVLRKLREGFVIEV